jgi:hypothetical protein
MCPEQFLNTENPWWVHDPYRLVTWWDMEKFAAEKFCNVCGNLSSMAHLWGKNAVVTPQTLQLLREKIADLKPQCEAVGLIVSAYQCETLMESFDKFSTDIEAASLLNPIQVSQSLTSLQSVLSNEMRTHVFLRIFPSRKDFYEQAELFGAGVNASFASAKEDVKESGCCYATDRTTACVMHLMRVLEVGLNTLAKELTVDFNQRNWENVINDCEVAIKKINGPSWGPDWKQKLQFYSGAAKDFRYFKDAWRNHAMHNRERYDADEAKTILEHVKAFMTQLADGGLKE